MLSEARESGWEAAFRDCGLEKNAFLGAALSGAGRLMGRGLSRIGTTPKSVGTALATSAGLSQVDSMARQAAATPQGKLPMNRMKQQQPGQYHFTV